MHKGYSKFIPFSIIVGLLGLLAILPNLIRALRLRWRSPEFQATLHAVGFALALDLIPILLCVFRGQGGSKK